MIVSVSGRMTSAWKIGAAILAIAIAPAVLPAQRGADVPSRPRLEPGADSNSGRANFQYGLRVVSDDPQESYRAFYWATRIDPTSADAWYALWTARQLIMPSRDLAVYHDALFTQRSAANLAVDSLLFRAYALDPFLYRGLDRPLRQRLSSARASDRNPTVNQAAVNSDLTVRLERKQYEGWILYADKRFDDALKAYANEMNRGYNVEVHKLDVHAERSKIFVLLDNLDSARAEMQETIAESRVRNRKDHVVIYDSTTMFEHALGAIDERAQHPVEARATYARIVQENPTFYPAHVRLSAIALAQGDTASAVSEMSLAVQLEPNDAGLRYRYADVLVRAKNDAAAAEQLRQAIALDPNYAAPYLLMASIADVEEYTDEAVADYQSYTVHTSGTDPQLPRVRGRLAKLSSSQIAAPSTP